MQADVVVAGHIAVDLIPALSDRAGGLTSLRPGQLVEAGGAAFSSGGCVANTGLALDRIGVPVRLIGCIGDDEFGELTLRAVRSANPDLVSGLQVVQGEISSYTIVLESPGIDRIFIHCPGVNHRFRSQHVSPEALRGARLFHFGYPPLMRSLFSDQGEEMALIMGEARRAGAMTSLDMAMPGSDEARRVDWPRWLQRVLPEVDLFLPSLDELRVMLPGLSGLPMEVAVREAAELLLDWGCAIVAIKLGDCGIYCRTAGGDRLQQVPHAFLSTAANWRLRELWAPCYQVDVIGTTGAGDCTIAGFIRGIVADLTLEETLQSATAVGACSVEAKDALGGLHSWEEIRGRIEEGWKRSDKGPEGEGWSWNSAIQIWQGRLDQANKKEVDE
ncbi:carbohydrate kinase family protein [Cohnella fermenti]|uniref:carbohydrate kinase family protein n=1 Tax=Cohnella fermenti TaxID=2565925 RepID=UPI001454C23E|nr:carbohydrate kinase family protein [Cohnella fermenti]